MLRRAKAILMCESGQSWSLHSIGRSVGHTNMSDAASGPASPDKNQRALLSSEFYWLADEISFPTDI